MKNKPQVLFECIACEEYVPVVIDRYNQTNGAMTCLKCGFNMQDVKFTGKTGRFEIAEIEDKKCVK